MKQAWLGLMAMAAALPSFGQEVEQLRRQLQEKETEVIMLRERIRSLERSSLAPQPAQPQSVLLSPDDNEFGNRALERALVRESSVLLPQSRVEVEPNFVISQATDSATGFQRQAYGPAFTVRAGLPWRTQVEVTAPYVFERRRSAGTVTESDGTGDFSVSLSHQLFGERGYRPSLVGTLGYQFGTGRNTLFESTTPVALGAGFDSVLASITALKRMDPLVFFGSYGAARAKSETRGGVSIEPGWTHSLRFGTGLAASPNTSLRMALSANFFSRTRVGGVAVPRSDEHQALLEVGGSVLLNQTTSLDVLLGAGLTNNAPDYRLSIALPIRF
jgi:hypothetical protein